MSTAHVNLSHWSTPAPGNNAQFTKEGPDWFAVFNLTSPTPNSPPTRTLDVDLVHSLPHDSVVCSLRFSPDGAYLATGSNHTTQVYNVATGESVGVLADHSVPPSADLYIRAVCFSTDGRYLATGAEDGNIRIWSTNTRTLHKRLPAHTRAVYALEYSPDGRLLVSASADNTVRVYDANDVHSEHAVQGAESVFVIDVPTDHLDGGITSLAISPTSTLIATAALDGRIHIWDVASRGALVAQLAGHTRSVYSVAFAAGASGMDLISGALDCTVKRWDLTPLLHPWGSGHDATLPRGERTCVCTYTYSGHEDYVLCVTTTREPGIAGVPQWIISASKDRTVKFCDATRGAGTATGVGGRPEVEFTLKGHTNSVIAVDASPAGGVFATAGGDWKARIWRYTML